MLGTETTSLWIALALYGVAAVNLALAAIVAHAGQTHTGGTRRRQLRSGKREENRVFALTLLCVALWAVSNALFRQADSLASATFWARFSYLPALLTAASFLHFSRVYPRRSPLSVGGKTALYLAALLIGALAFVPGLMVREVMEDGGSRRLLTGSGLYLVAVYMVTASALAFALFWRNQKSLRGRPQAQARYVLFGTFLTAIIGLWFNLLLPLFGDYHRAWLGPLGSIFVAGFTVYSILTQQLFDVRILIQRTVLGTLLLAFSAGMVAAAQKGLEQLFNPNGSFFANLVTALLLASIFEPIKRYFSQSITKRLFQGELADGREQMDD